MTSEMSEACLVRTVRRFLIFRGELAGGERELPPQREFFHALRHPHSLFDAGQCHVDTSLTIRDALVTSCRCVQSAVDGAGCSEMNFLSMVIAAGMRRCGL
jgi:hypothetical protein